MAAMAENTINGVRYEMAPLPSRKAYRVLLKLTRTVSSGFEQLAENPMAAIGMIARSLDEATLDSVIDTMADATLADGKPLKPIFDLHFQGKMNDMRHWLMWALELNYGDFTSALLTDSAQLSKAADA